MIVLVKEEMLLRRAMTSAAVSSSSYRGPVGERIVSKLTSAPSLAPVVRLEVLNESHMHSVPPKSETHFKVVCVSASFQGKSLVERHRMVNHLLKEELESGVHALSLVLRTPDKDTDVIPASPACRGGSKLEKQKTEE